MSRRWRGLKPPRGKFWTGYEKSTVPAWPPVIIRQAGPSPRWAARLVVSRVRGRWYDPGWGQANQGQAWPSFIRQAGPSPRYGARLNRSQPRRFNLPYPATVAVVPVAPPTGGGKSMLARSMRWADL